jgi:hypothetical protein
MNDANSGRGNPADAAGASAEARDAARAQGARASAGAGASAEARGAGTNALNAHAASLDQSGGKQSKLTFTRRATGGFVGKRLVSRGAPEVVGEGFEWIDEEIAYDDLDGVFREVKAHAATGGARTGARVKVSEPK